ncbi:hypothetical protein DL93DRAFT_2077467 [Clavulina sp. PMI_390]|nr:hypothetical protein DL93DRAFT_2077467 [Clavulina sp. PMI_390]
MGRLLLLDIIEGDFAAFKYWFSISEEIPRSEISMVYRQTSRGLEPIPDDALLGSAPDFVGLREGDSLVVVLKNDSNKGDVAVKATSSRAGLSRTASGASLSSLRRASQPTVPASPASAAPPNPRSVSQPIVPTSSAASLRRSSPTSRTPSPVRATRSATPERVSSPIYTTWVKGENVYRWAQAKGTDDSDFEEPVVYGKDVLSDQRPRGWQPGQLTAPLRPDQPEGARKPGWASVRFGDGSKPELVGAHTVAYVDCCNLRSRDILSADGNVIGTQPVFRVIIPSLKMIGLVDSWNVEVVMDTVKALEMSAPKLTRL